MAILIIAVFCLLCVGSYLIFQPGMNVTYHEVNLTNSCSAMVPVTEKVSNYTDNLDIHYYDMIYVFLMEENFYYLNNTKIF